MRVARSGQPEGLLQRNLPGRTGQQIRAAHDMRDMLCGVIDHNCKLVSDDPVLASDYEVTELALREAAPPLYSIVKEHHGLIGKAQAGRGWNVAASWSGAARAGITGHFASAQLAARATAFESQSPRGKLMERCEIERQTLALISNFAIPLESKLLESAQYIICTTRYYSGSVEILHAHKPTPALRARIEVAADCCQERAEMEIPGR